MLPNWLYGKSKSKLANILGDGSQALTNQVNSIVNVLGAKNLLPNEGDVLNEGGITYTENSDGTITVSGVTTTEDSYYGFTNFYLDAGTYILSGCPDINDSTIKAMLYIGSLSIMDYGSGVQFTLNARASIDAFIKVFSGADLSTPVIFKPMVRPASITNDTYVPYAMTNQEVTEKLTADASLDTAVDLSTYTAYSNMYTAPSDGYVHFQSAESGSTARTIYTYGNNTTAATDPHFTHSTSANNKAFEIYVRKGLKIYVDGLQSGDAINFYPLL